MRSSFCLLERQRRTTIKPIRAVLRRSPDPIVRLAGRLSQKRGRCWVHWGRAGYSVNRRGTAPSCKSTRSRLRIPMPTRLHHAVEVEYDQQLAHAGDQCNFLGLADRMESLVEDPNHRVVASGYQRSRVKRRPHPRPAAPYSASASHNPAVPVDGAHSTRAAICLRSSVPSSGKYARMETETCSPNPGTERSRSSFCRHTGLRSRVSRRSWSKSFRSFLIQLMWASILG